MVATLQVWKGSANNVKAGFPNDLYLSLPRGAVQKLKASVESQQPLLAPIAPGQRVGTMKLLIDGKPLRELPVVALESVPLAGIFGRGWDALRLMFR
jgi:D-alanyl-D-alanine carboxypeptidase (penicillin-binding protein 5/6)